MIRELNTSMASVWPMGPAMAHFVIPVRGEAPLQQTKQIQVYYAAFTSVSVFTVLI